MGWTPCLPEVPYDRQTLWQEQRVSCVLILGFFSCLRGLTLSCSSALPHGVCQLAHTLCSPLCHWNNESITVQRPCMSGSELCQCACFSPTSKKALVSVRLLHYRGGCMVQEMQPGAVPSSVKSLPGTLIQGGGRDCFGLFPLQPICWPLHLCKKASRGYIAMERKCH